MIEEYSLKIHYEGLSPRGECQYVLCVGFAPSKKNLSQHIAFLGTQSFNRLIRVFHDVKLNGTYEYNFINIFLDEDKKKFNEKFLLYKYMKHYRIIALGDEASNYVSTLHNSKQIPHPSGLNRIWNNKEKYAEIVKELEEFLK